MSYDIILDKYQPKNARFWKVTLANLKIGKLLQQLQIFRSCLRVNLIKSKANLK